MAKYGAETNEGYDNERKHKLGWLWKQSCRSLIIAWPENKPGICHPTWFLPKEHDSFKPNNIFTPSLFSFVFLLIVIYISDSYG